MDIGITRLAAFVLLTMFTTSTVSGLENGELPESGNPARQTTDEKQPEAAEKETDAENASASKAKERDPREIFRPSEEISEDFAVSFPVDI